MSYKETDSRLIPICSLRDHRQSSDPAGSFPRRSTRPSPISDSSQRRNRNHRDTLVYIHLSRSLGIYRCKYLLYTTECICPRIDLGRMGASLACSGGLEVSNSSSYSFRLERIADDVWTTTQWDWCSTTSIRQRVPRIWTARPGRDRSARHFYVVIEG